MDESSSDDPAKHDLDDPVVEGSDPLEVRVPPLHQTSASSETLATYASARAARTRTPRIGQGGKDNNEEDTGERVFDLVLFITAWDQCPPAKWCHVPVVPSPDDECDV